MSWLSLLLAVSLTGPVYGHQEPTGSTASPGDVTGPAKPKRSSVPLKKVEALYPKAAIEGHLQGEVLVNVLVNEAGEVENAIAISGEEILQPSAIDAAKQWKFEPYVKDGKAIKFSTTIPFKFALVTHESQPKYVFKSKVPPVTAVAERTVISSEIAGGGLVHKVEPYYPLLAKDQRIQGTVLLLVDIGKDGKIGALSVVSGPQELVQSAVDAVERWRYRPFLINGEAANVQTDIRVNFVLSR